METNNVRFVQGN